MKGFPKSHRKYMVVRTSPTGQLQFLTRKRTWSIDRKLARHFDSVARVATVMEGVANNRPYEIVEALVIHDLLGPFGHKQKAA